MLNSARKEEAFMAPCKLNPILKNILCDGSSAALIALGRQLLLFGKCDEAMKMFDASFHALTAPMKVDSTLLQILGGQQLGKGSNVFSSPVDIYCENDSDSGPRPFIEALVPTAETSREVLHLMICYNKALVHHARAHFLPALQLYNVIIQSITAALANNSLSADMCLIAMRVYNNLGQISFIESSEDAALLHFETSVFFARRTDLSSKEELLACADILSNWCRAQWMFGDLNDSVFSSLEEVLRIRSSTLNWDDLDVAGAHFNLALAEYSRGSSEKSRSHFLNYLSVAAEHSKNERNQDLDPIPAIVYVLLIANEDKQTKTACDLVWGLRALQQKRQELGRDHAEVASILNFVGTLLFHQQDLEHALVFFQEELRLEEQLVGSSEAVSVSVTCNNIGRSLQELGRYHEAILYYRRSLQPRFGEVMKDLDNVKGKDEQMKTNIEIFGENEYVPRATMNLYSTVWYNLGLIYDKMGRCPDAIKAFQMSLTLRRAMLGHDHADVACLLYNIGVLQMEQEQLSEATKSFREALRIRQLASTGQLNDKHVVKTLQKLASLHKAKGNIDGALEACTGTLHILQASSDFDEQSKHSSLGLVLMDMAELHHARGNLDVSLSIAMQSVNSFKASRESAAIFEAEFCSTLEHLVAALLLIGSLHHERCDPFGAQRFFEEACRTIGVEIRSLLSDKLSSLLPLLEVSSLLAHTHCAPEA